MLSHKNGKLKNKILTASCASVAHIEVRLTAYHKGHFEFRLCQNNVPQLGTNSAIAVTQDCFDRHQLTDPSGNSRFPAREGTSINLVKLPVNVWCEACILQWRYIAGEYVLSGFLWL